MKRLLTLLLAAAMVLALAACGGSSERTSGTPETPAPTPAPTPEPTPEPSEAPQPTAFAVGDTIALDFVELTFDTFAIEPDIQQSVTSGYVTRITGPQPQDGKKFAYLRGTIKNLATEALPVHDFFLGEFDINGYRFEVSAGECDILDGEGQTVFQAEPLTTYSFTMYAAIPDELADAPGSVNFRFGFYDLFDNEELSRNRAFEDDPISLCPHLYAATLL